MKRILLVITTVLLAAVVVVVSMLGSSPRTVYMAAMDAIKEGNYEMAVSHLKRSDHPDAELLLSQMYYVPNKIEVVETTDEGDLISNENYVYNLAGQLYKHESTAADGTLTVSTNTYADVGHLLLTKTEITLPLSEEVEEEEPADEEEGDVDDLFSGNQVEYFYDELGNLLCKRTFDSTGLFYQYRYTYDAASRVISEVYVDGEAYWTRREFTYNSDNLRIAEKYTDYDNKWKNTTYTYKEGFLHTETVENSDSTVKTVYDKDGKVLTSTLTRGKTSHVTKYTYDGDGNLLKKQYPEGHADVYRYNEQGLLTHSEQLGPVGKIATVTNCTYDEDGNMLTRATKVEDRERKETFTYNKSGKLVKKEYVDFNGEVTTTEISYERYGNPETIVETTPEGTVTTTIQWKVRYYPDGMPDNVREVYELYDVDKPIEE